MRGVEELRRLIREAFPAKPFFGSVTGVCTCDECLEIARSLRHRSWESLHHPTLDSLFGSLPLLSDDAFAAFLPAWLMRSLDTLDAGEQKFREWTLYELALYEDRYDDPDELRTKTSRLRRRYQSLSSEQVRVVREFLLLLRDHAHITSWDQESIDRTLSLLGEL